MWFLLREGFASSIRDREVPKGTSPFLPDACSENATAPPDDTASVVLILQPRNRRAICEVREKNYVTTAKMLNRA
jgi:hypothetical protein